ncbi:carbohydrate ABC transporter permease [Halococcus hamelinensis]|uniref:Binding-protein-dependent transporters inner membrane component n=1 Tax=Halococcus hamelinensis 100A6 TaxID=1132509 RepID=M0M091_9EURY|nr:sugar ABC transporter permease [Halococcus hamelinensis]EMA38014.1 binding-protein-dependent transporters inner membrane component [Halococcus hamelinensis 100A6]
MSSIDRRTELYDELRYKRQRLNRLLPSTLNPPFVLLSPMLILFAVFLAFPIFFTLVLSFFVYQGVSAEPLLGINLGLVYITIPQVLDLQFVGLQHFERMLSDSVLHQSLFNTVYLFAVLIPTMVIIPLGLAIALNSALIRFRNTFRSLLLIPTAANTIAYSVVFVAIVAEGGLADSLFVLIGIDPIAWLQNGFWSRNLIAFMSVWRWTGYNMIIFLAGLQTISGSLYEAAEIDGATRLQKFRYITIPQLRPVLLFIIVTSTISIFKKFAEPQILISSGAPLEETRTIVYYIYQVAFQNLELGYGSALTVLLVVIVSVISLMQFRVGD